MENKFKRFLSLLLALVMVIGMTACGAKEEPAPQPETPPVTEAPAKSEAEQPQQPEAEPEAAGMAHADYIAAELDAEVVVETYVQGHQSWWDNKITVYCQSPDGAYFLYELACSEEDAAKLTQGTWIRVTGVKKEWEGMTEIMDCTFEFIEKEAYVAEATDVTELLGTDELIAHQNEFVSFTGLTVEAIEYKNGEPGDDIYVTVSKDGNKYDFCVERYLTAPDTEVYQAVGALAVGDKVDITGFIYWYEGVNTHITAISK